MEITIIKSRAWGGLLLAAVLALPVQAAQAQATKYPERPIRFLVGFAAGGVNDLVARLVAGKLGPRLGQQVIVDNRAGGGGVLAHELLVNAAPDGYTMILASVTGLAMAPALRGKLSYDPVRDFAPAVQVVDAVTLFSAHPSSASKTLKDLVERAKRQPGVLVVGSTLNVTSGLGLYSSASGGSGASVASRGKAGSSWASRAPGLASDRAESAPGGGTRNSGKGFAPDSAPKDGAVF